MGRRQGGRVAGAIWRRIVNDKTGKVAEIRLDKMGWFSCRVGDSDQEYKQSQTANDVVAFAEKFVKTPDIAVTWTPVMHVEVEQDNNRYYRRSRYELSVNIKMEAKRFWVTRTALGVWRVIHEWAKLDPKSPGKLTDAEALNDSESWSTANDIENPSDRYGGAPKRGRPFKLPHQLSEGDVLMQYDPVLWAGVGKLVAAIEQEFKQINELLATSDGHAQLREIGGGTAQFAIAAESESTRAEKKKAKR